MSTVFANGLAIACKTGDSKVVAAFPDVCLTPPTPPAGPIPVPYPDSSFSKDMQNGSKTVQIGGDEVMLKDQSFYKTSPLGDEAATNGQGANVITHVITGKTYFAAWSMDVKFEGANVDRFSDLTTSNHASDPAGEAVPIPDLDAPAPPNPEVCKKIQAEIKPHSEQQKNTGGSTGKESHHVMQNAFFQQPRGTSIAGVCPGYNTNKAPCIALDTIPHRGVSAMQAADGSTFRAAASGTPPKNPTYNDARKKSKAQMKSAGLTDEEAECVMIKVDQEMKKMCPNLTGKTQLRAPGERSSWVPRLGSLGGASAAV